MERWLWAKNLDVASYLFAGISSPGDDGHTADLENYCNVSRCRRWAQEKGVPYISPS